MKNRNGKLIVTLIVSLCFFSFKALGIDQTITLKPGWNSIYLEVEPNLNRWDNILQGLPIDSVRTWNPNVDHVEFIQDPSELLPESPNWLSYFPPTSPVSFLNNLHLAQGGKAYLIKVTGNEDVEITFSGNPVLPKINWKPNSFNLVGFHLDPGNEPFFQYFFESSPSLADQEIYRLSESGTWEKLLDPATTQMKHSESFWVFCKEPTTFTGPLEIIINMNDGIDFGASVTEHSLIVNNAVPNNPLTLSTTGNVPLAHWVDPPSEDAGWNTFTGSISFGTTGKEKAKVRLAVRRTAMAGAEGSGVLELNNGEGVRIYIPTRAENLSDYTGLWAGDVQITQVSQSSDTINPELLKPVANSFNFRLILHVDENGVATLLREVIIMWKDGISEPDQTTGGNRVVEPGSQVLITDSNLINQYQGSILKNGQAVGQRISSAAFSFSQPQVLSGSFPVSLMGTIQVLSQDPTNPFKHKYHPDHDNLDARFEETIEEAYSVTRNVELTFTNQDPDLPAGLSSITWGDSENGGTYREELVGLHKNPIFVEGTFRLYRLNAIATLNDGR